jgi:ribosomal protein S18 acetylase RimI-like enzyme
MSTDCLTYTTKELSSKTGADFERLFQKPGGWSHCWCMHFQRTRGLPKNGQVGSRAERTVRNRRQKLELVEEGRAHGILVYAKGEAVGWCQFGPRRELPRIDHRRKYRGLAPDGDEMLWRITCFVVETAYRRRGIASAALKAALEAIQRSGGGLVEAYPLKSWFSRAFGNESTPGVLAMFEKQGFKVVAPFGTTRFSTRVLGRKRM